MLKKAEKPLKHLGKLLLAKQMDYEKNGLRVSGTGYAYRNTDGHDVFEISAACFASFRNKYHKGISEFVFSLKNERGRCDKKDFNAFVKWIITDSPFAKNFKTKRLCDAHKYGLKWDNTQCLNSFLTGCVAIRCYWEYTNNMRTWNILVDHGVNKNIALVCTHALAYDNAHKYFIKNNMAGGGHAIFGDLKKETVEDFILHGVDDLKREKGYHFFGATRTIYRSYNELDDLRSIANMFPSEMRKAGMFGEYQHVGVESAVKVAKEWEQKLFGEKNA